MYNGQQIDGPCTHQVEGKGIGGEGKVDGVKGQERTTGMDRFGVKGRGGKELPPRETNWPAGYVVEALRRLAVDVNYRHRYTNGQRTTTHPPLLPGFEDK